MPKKITKGKGKAKAEPIRLERVLKRVKHNYLDDELIAFGYALGQKYRSIRAVQSEKKAVVADYAAREKSLESEIDEISGKINAGFEMRGKDCFKMYDFKGGVVYWFLCNEIENAKIDPQTFPDAEAMLEYLLTDEVFNPVMQRPIRDAERQAKLFAEERDPEAKADGDAENQPEVETS